MTAEQYSVNLGITSWEIDFFGRIRSLKDQALEEYLATDQARRSAQIHAGVHGSTRRIWPWLRIGKPSNWWPPPWRRRRPPTN